MTITVPDPSVVSTWAWVVTGLFFWYVGVAIFMRCTKTGQSMTREMSSDEPTMVGVLWAISPIYVAAELIVLPFYLIGKLLYVKR